MNEKKLIDQYKKQLAQSKEKAPEGLWDDIAKKMDTEDEGQLISLYNEQLQKSHEKAPEGLWDDIAREMDIDEIWVGIANGLDKEEKRVRFWWFNRKIAAAIALLLISTMSVWLMRNITSPQDEFAETDSELTMPTEQITATIDDIQQEGSVDTNTQVTQPEFRINIASRNDGDDSHHSPQYPALITITETDKEIPDNETTLADPEEDSLFNDFPTLYSIQAYTASLTTLSSPSLQISSHNFYIEAENDYNITLPDSYASSGVLAFGFTTAMKNTWLFNHETFQGFNSGSGSVTHLQVYPDVAVSLRYAVSERWEMESSLSFSSNTGQSYEQYIFGRFSQREIMLNYFHTEVLANFKHRKRWIIRSNAISHSSAVGIYYGVLNSAIEIIAGQKEDISTSYRRDDYGIITGHQLNIPISGRLLFSPGIYITWGLPNIYEGEHVLPSLKRTHNRSAELRFSLYYNFLR